MNRFCTPLLFACSLLSACGYPGHDTPVSVAAITGSITQGSPDGDTHPQVAALLNPDGAVVCSATLIDDQVLMTAAHCPVGDMNLGGYRAFFGAKVQEPGTVVDVVYASAHPGFDGVTFDNDVALVLLATSPSIEPAIYGGRVQPMDELEIVGFGATDPSLLDFGVRRTASTHVDQLDPTSFRSPGGDPQPCLDDSGGPAFIGNDVVGVVSHGDNLCEGGATYTRVEAYADFVGAFLVETRPGAAKVGEPCLYAEHCDQSACVSAPDDARIKYCASACGKDGDCPSPMRCSTIAGEKLCRYPIPTPGAIDAPCAGGEDCSSGVCAPSGLCSERCVTDEQCTGDRVCTVSGASAFCTRRPPAPADGGCGLSPAGRDRSSTYLILLAIGLTARRRRGAIRPR